MILSLPEYKLKEDTQGKYILPSEKSGVAINKCFLRDFILLNHRLYGPNILEETKNILEMKVKKHSLFEEEYFILEISVESNDLITYQVKENLINNLLAEFSISEEKGIKGQRAVFVSETLKEDKLIILISTTVLYNDFRCTTCYPNLLDIEEINTYSNIISKKLDYIEKYLKNINISLILNFEWKY